MSINIGIFAGGKIGLEVLRFLDEIGETLSCVVFDSNGNHEITEEITHVASRLTNEIIDSSTLYEDTTIATLKSLNSDLLILAWWPYIIKEILIDLPRIGVLNFHPSFLPYNRGKHYNFWSIIEDSPFGVSLHFVNKTIDTGAIAFQDRILTTWEDTGKTLYDKAQTSILELFKKNFRTIKQGEIPRHQQDLMEGSFHLGKELEPASEIILDNKYTARQLLNLLRARTFHPHPGCFFTENGETFEVRIDIKKQNDSMENK